MMKKIVLMMVALFMISAVGFAAPMTDFTLGKWQVDVTVRPDLDTNITTYWLDGWKTKGKTNVDLAITAGIGNDSAVQYKHNQSNSVVNQTYTSGTYHQNWDYDFGMNTHELNYLRKLDKNSAAFVGIAHSKMDMKYRYHDTNGGNSYQDFGDGSTTSLQVGLQTTVPVSEKLDGYGVVALGTKMSSFEIGLAYKASKNLDVNLSYVDRKYKDLGLDNYNTGYDNDMEYSSSGVGLGVSYRF